MIFVSRLQIKSRCPAICHSLSMLIMVMTLKVDYISSYHMWGVQLDGLVDSSDSSSRVALESSGPWFNIEVSSYQLRKSHGCIPGGCTIICCWFLYISWESFVWGLLLLCSLMMCANNRVHSGLMVVFVCLHITLPHYHHYADISEGIELQTCLSGIFCLKCGSKVKLILLTIYHAIHGAVHILHIQLIHFLYDDLENTCTLIYYHHQIGSMTHLPLFRVQSWINGMCCMSFYIFIKLVYLHNVNSYTGMMAS